MEATSQNLWLASTILQPCTVFPELLDSDLGLRSVSWLVIRYWLCIPSIPDFGLAYRASAGNMTLCSMSGSRYILGQPHHHHGRQEILSHFGKGLTQGPAMFQKCVGQRA